VGETTSDCLQASQGLSSCLVLVRTSLTASAGTELAPVVVGWKVLFAMYFPVCSPPPSRVSLAVAPVLPEGEQVGVTVCATQLAGGAHRRAVTHPGSGSPKTGHRCPSAVASYRRFCMLERSKGLLAWSACALEGIRTANLLIRSYSAWCAVQTRKDAGRC
jgi:hypothetical protein